MEVNTLSATIVSLLDSALESQLRADGFKGKLSDIPCHGCSESETCILAYDPLCWDGECYNK